MPKLFGVDIVAEIARELKGQLVPGTLTKVTAGTRTTGDLAAGTQPTTLTHSFEGFLENRTERRIPGTLVATGGMILSILGGSLPAGVEPAAGDRATIEGSEYSIISIEKRDPAGALFECRVET